MKILLFNPCTDVILHSFLFSTENTFHYDLKEDESFIITYPQFGKSWTVIFKPKNGEEQETVMKGGRLVLKFHRFTERINIKGNGIEIENVGLKDSGTFEFRDSQGNLAMAVHLNVSAGETHIYFYVLKRNHWVPANISFHIYVFLKSAMMQSLRILLFVSGLSLWGFAAAAVAVGVKEVGVKKTALHLRQKQQLQLCIIM